MTGLAQAKFQIGLKKVNIGEKASEEMLKDLNKSVKKKMRPVINKKYPGATFSPRENHRNYYQDMSNLYDPPNEYTIEERIIEMEDYLYSKLKKILGKSA